VELVSARYASANIGSNTLSVLQLPKSLPLALSLLLQPIPVLQASQRASLLLHMVSALDRNITLDPRELRPSSEFSFIHLAVEAATFNGSTHYRVVFKAFRRIDYSIYSTTRHQSCAAAARIIPAFSTSSIQQTTTYINIHIIFINTTHHHL
jgi:hypothetical protein